MCYFINVDFRYGIKDGQLMPKCDAIGSCYGTDYNSDVYNCGGTEKFIKWTILFQNLKVLRLCFEFLAVLQPFIA